MTGLEFLYKTAPGRVCLKALTHPGLSRAVGRFLDTPASKFLIRPFVKSNGIDLSQYEADDFHCFNDCFCRRVKPGRRPVDTDPAALIAPCDGLLSVYPIRDGAVLPVKQSAYTLESLLGGDPVWREFREGTALVFRLCVDNYHRYGFVDSGVEKYRWFIPGVLHTVRPIALQSRPVFTENCREITLFDTDNLGLLAQIEVGAMLVGKIANHPPRESVKKGEEKGAFLYGGSTIIVLLQKNRAIVHEKYLEPGEKPVKYGQRIGTVPEKGTGEAGQ